MARIRSIKPETFTDELLGSLPREIRLLYIGLWSMADDAGRFRASPGLVRSSVFPYDDDLTNRHLAEWLEILAKTGRIQLYEVDGQRYGVVLRFLDHQRIERPSVSQLPEPPNTPPSLASRSIHRGLTERSVNDHRGLTDGMEGNGEEGNGREKDRSPAPPVPSPQELQELWNQTVSGKLPEVRELTEKRKRHVRARTRPDRDLAWWRALFARVLAVPFLVGENDRGWRADFDFVIRGEDSIAKILEGAYERAARPAGAGPPGRDPPAPRNPYRKLAPPEGAS